MNDDLDPELKSLFAADAEDAPDAAKMRVANALAASVPAFAVAGGGTAGAAHLSKHAAMSATRAYTMTAIAFALGTAAGAAGLAALRPAPAKTETAPALTIDAGNPFEAPLVQVPSAPHPDLPVATAADAGPSDAHLDISTSATDVAAERALLDDARTALNQGNAAEALRTLEQHRARFPHGQLGEERDAMIISALVKANRREDAEKRAAAFRARSPNSLFLPMIDAALRKP